MPGLPSDTGVWTRAWRCLPSSRRERLPFRGRAARGPPTAARPRRIPMPNPGVALRGRRRPQACSQRRCCRPVTAPQPPACRIASRRSTGTKQQEEVMGKAVPQQHPAVVLRSHYNHLRALLIAALIAVLGLAGAVVIVANDDDTVVSTSTPAIESGSTVGASAGWTARPRPRPRAMTVARTRAAPTSPRREPAGAAEPGAGVPRHGPAGRGGRESPRHSHGPATAAGRRCHEPGQRRRDDVAAGRPLGLESQSVAPAMTAARTRAVPTSSSVAARRPRRR